MKLKNEVEALDIEINSPNCIGLFISKDFKIEIDLQELLKKEKDFSISIFTLQ
jgi:hypothetical protein